MGEKEGWTCSCGGHRLESNPGCCSKNFSPGTVYGAHALPGKLLRCPPIIITAVFMCKPHFFVAGGAKYLVTNAVKVKCSGVKSATLTLEMLWSCHIK